jgi:hypothetical protein
MVDYLLKQLPYLPPLRRRKNPVWALVIGFVTGGIGLGVYLRSLVDVVIPIILAVGVAFYSAQALEMGWTLGPGIAAAYGYARVQDSNARIADLAHEAPAE